MLAELPVKSGLRSNGGLHVYQSLTVVSLKKSFVALDRKIFKDIELLFMVAIC